MNKKLLMLSGACFLASSATWSANFESLKDGDTLSGIAEIEITANVTDNLRSIYTWTQFYWPAEVGGGIENPKRLSLPALQRQIWELDTTQMRNGEHDVVICDTQLVSDGTGSCDTARVVVSNADTIAPDLRQHRPGILVRPDEYIFGDYTLAGRTIDESGIQEVRFLRDEGILLGTVTQPLDTNINAYQLEFDTRTVDNGLHHFYMEAVDNLGNVASTKEGSLFVFDIAPIKPRYVENRYVPSNVYARAKRYKVNVVWQGSDQEERYAIYRRLDNESHFSRVGETDYTVFVDNLPTSTAYAEYYVTAVYRYGESDASEIYTVAPTVRRR